MINSLLKLKIYLWDSYVKLYNWYEFPYSRGKQTKMSFNKDGHSIPKVLPLKDIPLKATPNAVIL